MKEHKIRVSITLEIDPIRGLDKISNTIKEVAEYAIEEGLDNIDDPEDIYKIINISSKDADVERFYPHGTVFYNKDIGFRTADEYNEWIDKNEELHDKLIDEIHEEA